MNSIARGGQQNVSEKGRGWEALALSSFEGGERMALFMPVEKGGSRS
jgi:hypothetical protein